MEAQLEEQARRRASPSHQSAAARWRNIERLISEELQRIAESYRSDAEVARAEGAVADSAMSGLVGANAGTNQTLVQLRELERESDTYQAISIRRSCSAIRRRCSSSRFPVTRGAGDHRGDAAARASYPKRSLILALSLVHRARWSARGLGALREYRDRVFRIAADVRDDLGLEFLGLLQAVDATGDGQGRRPSLQDLPGEIADRQRAAALFDRPSAVAVHRDAALGQGRGRSGAWRPQRSKVIGVISALPNEGKSTVAKNFASLLAHLGARAVLIDGDLRNPGLTLAIARHAEVGLLEVDPRRAVRCASCRCSSRDSGLVVSARRHQEAHAASERTPRLAGHARAVVAELGTASITSSSICRRSGRSSTCAPRRSCSTPSCSWSNGDARRARWSQKSCSRTRRCTNKCVGVDLQQGRSRTGQSLRKLWIKGLLLLCRYSDYYHTGTRLARRRRAAAARPRSAAAFLASAMLAVLGARRRRPLGALAGAVVRPTPTSWISPLRSKARRSPDADYLARFVAADGSRPRLVATAADALTRARLTVNLAVRRRDPAADAPLQQVAEAERHRAPPCIGSPATRSMATPGCATR